MVSNIFNNNVIPENFSQKSIDSSFEAIGNIFNNQDFDKKFCKPLKDLHIDKSSPEFKTQPLEDLREVGNFLELIEVNSFNSSLYFLIPLNKDPRINNFVVEMYQRFFNLFFYLLMPFTNNRHIMYCWLVSPREKLSTENYLYIAFNFSDEDRWMSKLYYLNFFKEEEREIALLRIKVLLNSFISYLLKLFDENYDDLFSERNGKISPKKTISSMLIEKLLEPNFYSLLNQMTFEQLCSDKAYDIFKKDFLVHLNSWIKEANSINTITDFDKEKYPIYLYFEKISLLEKTESSSAYNNQFSLSLHYFTEIEKLFLVLKAYHSSSSFNKSDIHSDRIFNFIFKLETSFEKKNRIKNYKKQIN